MAISAKIQHLSVVIIRHSCKQPFALVFFVGKTFFKASWKIPFKFLTVAIMNVAITSSSSVEVEEFLEGEGLGEITDKLTQ